MRAPSARVAVFAASGTKRQLLTIGHTQRHGKGYLLHVAGITMYDTALNDQFPAGAAAYAAYVDGGVGDQPNFAFIVSAFPKAQHLSIALFAANNADALDVEPGASAPSDIPGWYARQVA